MKVRLATGIGLLALLYWLEWVRELMLRRAGMVSGCFLAGCILFLLLYHTRKKIPVLPLGSSRSWLQLHLFTGCLSLVVFGMHIGFRWPSGLFEQLLALAFLVSGVSGIVGWIFSRQIPKQLRQGGLDMIYEDLPQLRRELARQTDMLVLAEGKTEGLVDFYTCTLRDALHRSRPLPAGMESRLDSFGLELDSQLQSSLEKLRETCRERRHLDRHARLQGLMKGWLFIHIPSSLLLLLFVPLHVGLVLLYGG